MVWFIAKVSHSLHGHLVTKIVSEGGKFPLMCDFLAAESRENQCLHESVLNPVPQPLSLEMIATATLERRLGTAGGFCLTLAGLLLLTFLVYRPGLGGPLLLDDYWNLQPLGEGGGITSLDALQSFVFGNVSGPSGRPVAMLSFVLDSQDWPPNVAALKYTNILLHLLTGVLVCWFSLILARLLGQPAPRCAVLGLLVAAFWLLHPFNLSTTLYVIQRMTQLMTLFALASLICYLIARENLEAAPRKAVILLVLCLFPFATLSVLSKENGALLLLVIVAMEGLLFAGRASTPFFRLWYRAGVVVPLLMLLGYLLFTLQDNLVLYEGRRYGLLERLLTESRVLLDYLRHIVIPDFSPNTLFFDDYVVSRGLFSPVTTLLAILAITGLLATAWHFRRRYPVYSFAVAWFFGLHLLESSYLPLELYFEHRNYLPMVGVLFAILWYVLKVMDGIRPQQGRPLVMLAIVGVLMLNGGLTWNSSRLWGDTLTLHASWAEQQPRSVRAQASFAEYLNAVELPEAAMERLQLAHTHYPNEVTVLLQLWNQSCAYGLPRPVSLQAIVENPDLDFFVNDVNQQLRVLLENLYMARCDYPDLVVMEQLFERISLLPIPDSRRAPFHTYFADLYIYHGQLDNALINLSRAFAFRPVPQLPVRQAILSASAGNFSDALVFLERAKIAERNNNPLKPSMAAEIDRLERDFRSRLDADGQ